MQQACQALSEGVRGMETARDYFKRKFGLTPPFQVRTRAPLELLGHLGLHDQGLALALTVDRHWDVAAAPRTDGRIEMVSSMFPGSLPLNSPRLNPGPAEKWARVAQSVLQQLQSRGVPRRGFNAAIHSSIPPWLGLGHTTALAAAIALIYRQLFPYALSATSGQVPPARDPKGRPLPLSKQDKLELAAVCRRVEEQDGEGAPPNLAEPVACLFGRPREIVELDGQSLAVELIPMVADFGLVLCDSGVRADWSRGRGQGWRILAQSTARRLGVASLRTVTPRDLPAAEKKLSALEFAFLRQGVEEVQRVLFGARAWREGDAEQFGQYMFQSHQSASLLNSCPELDYLVARARRHPACLGARLAGSGCGGATLNLVHSNRAEDFMRLMAEPYKNQPAHRAAPLWCGLGEEGKLKIENRR